MIVEKSQNFRKLILGLLIINVFISSIGLNIDFHLCQDEVKSFSFYSKAKSCCTAADQIEKVAFNAKTTFSKKKCCKNINIFEKASFQLTPLKTVKEIIAFQLLSIPVFANVNEKKGQELVSSISIYAPPDLLKKENHIITNQVFLI